MQTNIFGSDVFSSTHKRDLNVGQYLNIDHIDKSATPCNLTLHSSFCVLNLFQLGFLSVF